MQAQHSHTQFAILVPALGVLFWGAVLITHAAKYFQGCTNLYQYVAVMVHVDLGRHLKE